MTIKVLTSPVTRIVVLIVGYFAALSLIRAFSVPFNYYMREIIGNAMKMPSVVAFPLFVMCVVVLFILAWQGKNTKSSVLFRRVDISLLVVFAFCFFLLGLNMEMGQRMLSPISGVWRFGGSNVQLLLLSILAYLSAMVALMETAARIRDKALIDTLYWLRFFRLYTIWQPIGLLMAVLLTGNLLFLLVVCPLNIMGTGLSVGLMALSASTLAALTYICAFVLSLSQEYAQANAEKIRAERFKAELITNVSHDIRTPLTSIINYVDLLKDLTLDKADFISYVDILDKKTARLKTLINDLMEASKAGTGNLSVDLREIDLAEMVGQIAGEFDDAFSEGALTLVYRQPDQPVPTWADSAHLWRALENLFGNAAKYAMPGTRVFAEIAQQEGRPVFSLKNTSQNPIDLTGDALTEQFIRGDRARQTEGSGLGLYITKSLMELMGGRLDIRVTGDLFEAAMVFAGRDGIKKS
ncbi:MAG: HAMP domain-containing histidine kinase [Gracilibacteraceae bacterium]|jgi:signal transduction histidine kinase|nr:HAMP domain-containing histidine kinase [Gracilibacteraceae bacterium]